MLVSPQLYLSQFTWAESQESITLRESLGILRCLIATEVIFKSRIVFARL